MILKKTWWHLYDNITPSDGRLVRHVLDFHTKNNVIRYSIPTDFVRLKIRSRNGLNSELSFLDEFNQREEGADILIDLGELKCYPKAYECNNGQKKEINAYHVKLEIEYIDITPVFEKRYDSLENVYNYFIKKLNKLKIFLMGETKPICHKGSKEENINEDREDATGNEQETNPFVCNGAKTSKPWLSGYKTFFDIYGPSLPEFSVKTPRGMYLKKNNSSICYLDIKDNKKGANLEFRPLYVSKTDGNEFYNLLIKKECWNQHYDDLNSPTVYYRIHYSVCNKLKFYFIPIIGLFLIFLGIYGVLISNGTINGATFPNQKTPGDSILLFLNGGFSILLAQIVILVSFTISYYNLRRGEYEIPFNKIVMPSLFLATLIAVYCVINYIQKFGLVHF
jgi:hypothetical protein